MEEEQKNNKKIKENIVKKLFIRIFEVIFAICIGGTGCIFFIYSLGVRFGDTLLALAISCIAISIGLITGLEKGNMAVKAICIIIGIICALLFESILLMA